ncbi:helix-turn-helix domain-containing protein [Rhizobium terrae]|uniref:helix-turn-helix domain-containing protein n=1 Tax=Rhizobium terrae TaxID=2171756 RepID=UPI000E3E5B6E|nr:type II toxin-antitoxin system MqsA family antitoxin [Rhizobium terrae]
MPKKSNFGAELIQAMSEALAHADGESAGATIVREIEVDTPDPKQIRRRLELTQDQMARVLGISVYGYRKWEQGHRRMSGPAANLLRVMEKEPEAVLRALSAA